MSQPEFIDARGPRFSAGITTAVLVFALFTRLDVLIFWQLAVFTVAAFYSMPMSPYGIFYRKVIVPRLKGPAPLESSKPPRFAQLVGLGFVLVATIGALTHTWALFTVATAACIFAAFLNSAFDYCLGCKVYLLGVKLTTPKR